MEHDMSIYNDDYLLMSVAIEDLVGKTVLALSRTFYPPRYSGGDCFIFHCSENNYYLLCEMSGYYADCWIEHLTGLNNLIGTPIITAKNLDDEAEDEDSYIIEFTTAKGQTQFEFRMSDEYGYGGAGHFLSYLDLKEFEKPITPIKKDF